MKRDINPWFIAVTVTLAAFMELLDTAVANVSLPHIAGGMARSYDEATWIRFNAGRIRSACRVRESRSNRR